MGGRFGKRSVTSVPVERALAGIREGALIVSSPIAAVGIVNSELGVAGIKVGVRGRSGGRGPGRRTWEVGWSGSSCG